MNLAQKEVLDLLELIQLERVAEKNLIEEQIRTLSLEERKKRGLTWAPVILRSMDYGTGGFLHVTLQKTTSDSYPVLFESGQVACIEPYHQSLNQNRNFINGITGVITKVYKDQLTIAIDNDDLPEWVTEGKFVLNYYFDDKTFKMMEQAVLQVAQTEKGRLAELREILLGYMPPRFEQDTNPINIPYLNPSQNAAIALTAQSVDACIIHGPPGTGKTTTLVDAILYALKKEKQVLVSAPSNLAVDLLVEKLVEKKVGVVRIGHPVRISESIQAHTLDSQIALHYAYAQVRNLRSRAYSLKSYALKYKRNYVRGERQEQLLEVKNLLREAKDIEKYIIQDILDKAQVIAATPVGCNFQEMKEKQFSTVFIDEAAQLLEPAAWIVISKAHRVVFAGDHCQLPPTVKSAEAEKKGLSVTLFEKFYQRQKVYVSQLLNVQYRMHDLIMSFSNSHFYNNALCSAPKVGQQKLFEQDTPILFIDTAGCGFEEQQNPETKSYFNPSEASTLISHFVEYVQNLQGFTDYLPSVGWISPYKEQVEYLQAQLPQLADLKQYIAHISIDSIDGFQGQERDIIYISLVRSNSQGQIGFLADTRRLNVALTRAKYKLVVIGDSATLGNHPFYKDMIDYFQSHNAYMSAWEIMYHN
ncbi:MAG: AAA domain-containing protein [Bacteroidia bacterium]|nr:AAA domain-containing protein [Bacteroidia bacterium]MDW8158817.1 AAA domain-containing protein [Bacteroidia bacterium]